MAQLTPEQRDALKRYSKASDGLSVAIGRVNKHLEADPAREPAWVLNQDVQAARREFHLAEFDFELAFVVSAQSIRQKAGATQ